MKHPKDNIDQFLRNSLSKTEVDLPDQAAFWDRIDPHKPKRRRPIILWIFAGLIGLATMLWTAKYYTIVNNPNEKSEIISGPRSQPTKKIKGQVENPSNSNKDNEHSIIKTHTSQKENSSRNKKSEQEQHPFTNWKLDTYNNKQTTLKTLASQEDLNTKKGASKFSSKPENSEDLNPIFQTEVSNALSQSKIDKNTKLPFSREISPPCASLPFGNSTEIIYVRNPFTQTPMLPPFIPNLAKDSIKQSRWFWQIHFEAGLVQNNIMLIDKDSSIPILFAEHYQQLVDPIASYQMQGAIGTRFSNKSRVSIGFEYQHVEKQFRKITESISLDNAWSEQALVSNGQFRADSAAARVIISTEENKPIRETFINLPLNYYHDVFQSGKISVALKAGLIFNFSRFLSGPQLSKSNQWSDLNWQRQSKVGMSYEIGAEAAYQLNRKSQFYITPKFRRNPHMLINEEVNVSIQKNVSSIELGFRAGF